MSENSESHQKEGGENTNVLALTLPERNSGIKKLIKDSYDFHVHSPTSRLESCVNSEVYRLCFNTSNITRTHSASGKSNNEVVLIKLKIFFQNEESCVEYNVEAYPSWTLKQLANTCFESQVVKRIWVRESVFYGLLLVSLFTIASSASLPLVR